MPELVFVGLVVLGVVVLWKMGSSSRGRASKRLVLVAFGALVAVTIIFPEVTTGVANLVGIGRGADLVLYLTAIGLMFLAALTYISQKRTEDRLADLISAQAVSEALIDFAPKPPPPRDGGAGTAA